MIKVELHTHTADDPADYIPHTTTDLIDRAAELGYGAVAITLHDRQLEIASLENYALERGIVLIPGVERTINGKHILLLNFPAVADRVTSFEEVAALKREHPDGIVIAPHPFFPGSTCLLGLMERHADLFDAVELSYFFTRQFNFNRRARAWATIHRKPVVGNGDIHRLYQLGRTYSLVDASPDVASICAAVKAGRVQAHTEPISMAEAGSYFADLIFGKGIKWVRQLWTSRQPAPEGSGA